MNLIMNLTHSEVDMMILLLVIILSIILFLIVRELRSTGSSTPDYTHKPGPSNRPTRYNNERRRRK